MGWTTTAGAAVLALGLAAGAARAAALTVVAQSSQPADGPSGGLQVETVSILAHSERLGRDLQITVTPPRVKTLLPGQRLPAVFALDGGHGTAGLEALHMSDAGVMAPAVVVAVGYARGRPNLRETDLLHHVVVESGERSGGGGAAFEAFLREDLKPFVAARFGVDPDRIVLFGHSYGGLFAANVFAGDPKAFWRYVMGSPSVWADPGVVAHAKAAAGLAHTRIYLAVGAAEDIATPLKAAHMRQGFDRMASALAAPGVALRAQVYPGETHGSYYDRLVLDAFPFVLPPIRPADSAFAPVSAQAAARLEGAYALAEGRTLTVSRLPSGELRLAGAAEGPLLPLGGDRFYAPHADLELDFDPLGANLSGGGVQGRATRVKQPR